MAVLADPLITERQKRVLIDVYGSFVKENAQPSEPAEQETQTETKSEDKPETESKPESKTPGE